MGVSNTSFPTPTPIPNAPASTSNIAQNLVLLGGSIKGGAALVLLGGVSFHGTFVPELSKRPQSATLYLITLLLTGVLLRSNTKNVAMVTVRG